MVLFLLSLTPLHNTVCRCSEGPLLCLWCSLILINFIQFLFLMHNLSILPFPFFVSLFSLFFIFFSLFLDFLFLKLAIYALWNIIYYFDKSVSVTLWDFIPLTVNLFTDKEVLHLGLLSETSEHFEKIYFPAKFCLYISHSKCNGSI